MPIHHLDQRKNISAVVLAATRSSAFLLFSGEKAAGACSTASRGETGRPLAPTLFSKSSTRFCATSTRD